MSLVLSYRDVDLLWVQTGDLLIQEYERAKVEDKQGELDAILGRIAPQFGLGMSTPVVIEWSTYIL